MKHGDLSLRPRVCQFSFCWYCCFLLARMIFFPLQPSYFVIFLFFPSFKKISFSSPPPPGPFFHIWKTKTAKWWKVVETLFYNCFHSFLLYPIHGGVTVSCFQPQKIGISKSDRSSISNCALQNPLIWRGGINWSFWTALQLLSFNVRNYSIHAQFCFSRGQQYCLTSFCCPFIGGFRLVFSGLLIKRVEQIDSVFVDLEFSHGCL